MGRRECASRVRPPVRPEVRHALLESLLERLSLDPRLGALVSPAELEAFDSAIEALAPLPSAAPGPEDRPLPEDRPEDRTVGEARAHPLDASAAVAPGRERWAECHRDLDPGSASVEVVASGPPLASECPCDRAGAAMAPMRRGRCDRTGSALPVELLEAVPTPGVVLCLDLGTADAKAAAVRDGRVVLPLTVGAGGRLVAPSTACLGPDGRLYFGERAVEVAKSAGRPRIDSLKRLFGRIPLGPQLRDLELSALGVRGAEGLGLFDLWTALLAWLGNRAQRALAEQHGIVGPVLRRLALPCWPSARTLALRPLLARAAAEALVLGAAFGDELEEGVPLHRWREAKERLTDASLPLQPPLIGRPVTEPVAAAASRFGPEHGSRGLVLVVDVGAGTTDIALFWLDADPAHGRFEVRPIDGATDLLSFAGDALDRVLLGELLGRLGGGRRARLNLEPELRALKRQLFCDGFIEVRVGPAKASLTRDDLLGRPELAAFESELSARVSQLVKGLPARFLHEEKLTVCLTGGGARLPMVAALLGGQTHAAGRVLEHQPGPGLPPFIRAAPAIAAHYPQLAVAVGGASGYLPKEGPNLRGASAQLSRAFR